MADDRTEDQVNRDIAVANLSQLKYTITSTRMGVVVNNDFLNTTLRVALENSLSTLGINTSRDIASDKSFHFQGDTLLLSRDAIAALIEAGVSTPTLDAVEGRKPAALRTLDR